VLSHCCSTAVTLLLHFGALWLHCDNSVVTLAIPLPQLATRICRFVADYEQVTAVCICVYMCVCVCVCVRVCVSAVTLVLHYCYTVLYTSYILFSCLEGDFQQEPGPPEGQAATNETGHKPYRTLHTAQFAT
jgi:hypothetical protein